MANNLPPGCSVSSIPGNRPEDAEFENACEMATAVCRTAIPQLFDSAQRLGILNEDRAEALVEAIANALITAYDNGYEKGYKDGKIDQDTAQIGYCSKCGAGVYHEMGYCGNCKGG